MRNRLLTCVHCTCVVHVCDVAVAGTQRVCQCEREHERQAYATVCLCDTVTGDLIVYTSSRDVHAYISR